MYAYYKIYSKNKNKYYFGLIDIKLNKTLYNLEEEITEFIPNPYSEGYEMLAITKNSAYKVCIFKSGNTCQEYSNIILDTSGNQCNTWGCSSGKIKFMPEGICIDKNLCDLNIYELNSEETECGLCSYINSENNNHYKLINTRGCISYILNNTDYYHENSKLLKCKDNYHLDNNKCIPNFCYETCETCFEIGTDINNQKCESCKDNYKLDNGNCIILPPTTTIINPPTTIINPLTTIINPPTTIINPLTTMIYPQMTMIIEEPITQIPEPISKNCLNERCDTCNSESNKVKLCLSCDENKYKKVNYTNNFSKYYDYLEEKKLEIKYYFDSDTEQYRPCYKLCKKCYGPGNAAEHNCSECEDNYMFRPRYNPNHNCVIYYYLSPYNEYKPLDSPMCPEVANYTLVKDNITFCIYDCKEDETHQFLYNGRCFNECPNGKSNENYICKETDPEKIYITQNEIYINGNDTIEIIEILAKTYAIEFN